MRGEASGVLGPAPRLVLAMALHENGRAEEARKTLAEAILAHDWRAVNVRDQDGWIVHVGLAIAAGQKPTLGGERRFRYALSAESCIRKAVAERGLIPGPVGLADTKPEDEAATGTAFALRVD
jgi:hypothetical protein